MSIPASDVSPLRVKATVLADGGSINTPYEPVGAAVEMNVAAENVSEVTARDWKAEVMLSGPREKVPPWNVP